MSQYSTPEKLLLWIAQGFGTGWSPVAPGTVGSLLGPLVVYLSIGLTGWNWQIQLSLIVVTQALGIWLCDKGAQLLGKKDPGSIVWDEIAAFWIVHFAMPITLPVLGLGFLLFRIFDILKPWPVCLFDRLEGGLGIMADDACAAVICCLILQTLLWYGVV